jgi:hypothetical protein
LSKDNAGIQELGSYEIGFDLRPKSASSRKDNASNLNLTNFTIDNDGDLYLRLEVGYICEIKKLTECTIPSFIKDVINAVHGVELDKKLAEWLLDKEPTIFDKKEVIIVDK